MSCTIHGYFCKRKPMTGFTPYLYSKQLKTKEYEKGNDSHRA